ncbi:protein TRIGALACTOSYLDIACYLGLYCEROL 2, chloroplastic-like isoform X3 [Actinidia eriantha]|uniref:protein TRIGALACTOSYLDIACYLGLYCEROL 2, chloroplastic-like isoform X3 n=1 Tax=Actinidia eriantha TaxID=165200 RepID=UPI0025892355|nr:protein TRIGALACTOSYLDIACYLGLYCEROL 2, chloroplastic-like isoform X3 [Actinidia eriantha]
MVVNSLVHVSTCPSVLSSSLITSTRSSSSFLPYLPPKSQKKLVRVRSQLSSEAGNTQLPNSSEEENPFAGILDFPRTVWRQTVRPLSDFGFGRRSIWEGGVGLFLVSVTVLLAFSLAWLRGFQLRSKFRKYLAVFEFAQACGICTGTPVRIRGVTVGNVIQVNPSLKSIEAVVEVCHLSLLKKPYSKFIDHINCRDLLVCIAFCLQVEDDKIIIPRNSLVEVNQSGLLMETLIDITPRDPIPTPSVGPLDPECVKEGVIVCDRQKIKGYQGVSLDALVGIFTRLGREVEEIGVANTYSLAERASSVIEEARPLLTKIKAMAEDVQPLLTEVRDSGLLKEIENLTKSLTEASEDLRI